MLKEIRSRVWRQLAWDQIHPRTGKYRPDYYPGCMKWTQLDETFRRLPDPTVKENRAARSKKWLYWMGGIYTFPYFSGDARQTQVTMTFDWLEPKKPMHWTVDTLTADAAYPGKHRGSLLHQEERTGDIDIEWETPIFSPYVRIQKRHASQARRADSVVGYSTCEVSDWSKKTTIICEKKEVSVMVLQNVMKRICNLLVHGPRPNGIPESLASPVELKVKYSSNDDDIAQLIGTFFGNEARLREAASFFSRAYCTAGQAKEERKVTSAERRATIESVDCLLEHFSILQEPPWMEDDDWVENLEKELKGVETYDAWQKIERKWATLASYSCGLELHQGPWAGPDW